MIVKDIADRFGLEITSGKEGLEREIIGGHCGDLLSEVMGNTGRMRLVDSSGAPEYCCCGRFA